MFSAIGPLGGSSTRSPQANLQQSAKAKGLLVIFFSHPSVEILGHNKHSHAARSRVGTQQLQISALLRGQPSRSISPKFAPDGYSVAMRVEFMPLEIGTHKLEPFRKRGSYPCVPSVVSPRPLTSRCEPHSPVAFPIDYSQASPRRTWHKSHTP